ncbi:MAG: hypothetical protein SGILL_003794 [Bacillariaceae sp.]
MHADADEELTEEQPGPIFSTIQDDLPGTVPSSISETDEDTKETADLLMMFASKASVSEPMPPMKLQVAEADLTYSDSGKEVSLSLAIGGKKFSAADTFEEEDSKPPAKFKFSKGNYDDLGFVVTDGSYPKALEVNAAIKKAPVNPCVFFFKGVNGSSYKKTSGYAKVKVYQCACLDNFSEAHFRARLRAVLTHENANNPVDGKMKWILQRNDLEMNCCHVVAPTDFNKEGKGSALRLKDENLLSKLLPDDA